MSCLVARKWYAWIIVTVLMIANGTLVWSQSTGESQDPRWNLRYEVFQLLLQQTSLRVERSIVKALHNPGDSVIVMMGNVDQFQDASWTDLRVYVDRGGKLLIAADGHFYSTGFGRIIPGPARTNVPELQFQGFEDCIRIQSLAKDHPLTEGLSEVVTNRSGWIDSQDKRLTWEDMLILPDSSNRKPLRSRARISPSPSDNKPIFTIGYSQRNDDGLVMLVADPSIFSNGMLWHADNGEFVVNVVNELASENRKTLWMVIDSQVQSQVNLPSSSKQDESSSTPPSVDGGSSPPLNSLLQVANAALKEVADPVQINDKLRDRPRNATVENYSRWVWTAAAAIVIGFVLWQLLNRSTWFAPYRASRQMKTARDLLSASRPVDLQNKIASETLAREFSRLWTGRNTDSDWRLCLDQLKHSNDNRLTAKDRTAVESIMAIAIFGGKATTGDAELERLCVTMQDLLSRFRPTATLLG